jgi:hypothetical protein
MVMNQSDTEARFLAVSYPLGGDLDTMVGPELVKTFDYLRFDLAFPTRAYFGLPNGYELLKEYPVGLTAMQAIRKFVRDFPPQYVALGDATARSAGWIAPNGSFYPGVNGHYTLAQYITTKLWMGPAGEEFLEDQGWCRVYYTGQITPPQCSYKKVTREQVYAVRALMQSEDDPDWREVLREFVFTVARAYRKPREFAVEFLQERALAA